MSIIGILAGMLLPALNAAKAKGQGIICMSNVRHPAPVLAVWFNPSGTQIMVNCKDRYGYLWDEHLRELVLEPFSDGNPSLKVAFSADGSKLANFGWFNDISVWSASSPGWQGHDIGVQEPMLVGEAEFSPDNQ